MVQNRNRESHVLTRRSSDRSLSLGNPGRPGMCTYRTPTRRLHKWRCNHLELHARSHPHVDAMMLRSNHHNIRQKGQTFSSKVSRATFIERCARARTCDEADKPHRELCPEGRRPSDQGERLPVPVQEIMLRRRRRRRTHAPRIPRATSIYGQRRSDKHTCGYTQT